MEQPNDSIYICSFLHGLIFAWTFYVYIRCTTLFLQLIRFCMDLLCIYKMHYLVFAYLFLHGPSMYIYDSLFCFCMDSFLQVIYPLSLYLSLKKTTRIYSKFRTLQTAFTSKSSIYSARNPSRSPSSCPREIPNLQNSHHLAAAASRSPHRRWRSTTRSPARARAGMAGKE